jgi:small subunit ribosomal protein S21
VIFLIMAYTPNDGPRPERSERSDRPERREGFETLLRRFFRDVQQSGILSEVKKRRYFSKDISRRAKREIASRKAARKRMKRGY